jgi:transposase-like protein
VTESARYTAEEERALREALASGTTPTCPRCGVRMTHRAIGGGSFGLGYHRQREWLLCPSCRRSAIFDVKRGTRT